MAEKSLWRLMWTEARALWGCLAAAETVFPRKESLHLHLASSDEPSTHLCDERRIQCRCRSRLHSPTPRHQYRLGRRFASLSSKAARRLEVVAAEAEHL